jgi:hypothetical protein
LLRLAEYAFLGSRDEEVVVADEDLDLFLRGLGRAKTPQFVKPRITPPFWRMRLPALRAMLEGLVSFV